MLANHDQSGVLAVGDVAAGFRGDVHAGERPGLLPGGGPQPPDDLGPDLFGFLPQPVGHVGRGAGDRRGGVVPVAGRVVVQVSGTLAEQLQRRPEIADRVAGDRDPQP